MQTGFGVVVSVAALAACGVPPREQLPASPDARELDAVTPDPGWLPDPIALTGSTPAGPVDLHYVYAWYGSAWCGYAYRVVLTKSDDVYFTNDPYLTIEVPAAEEATAPLVGPLAAVASLTQRPTSTSDVQNLGYAEFTFQAEAVDLPLSQAHPRIAGRVQIDVDGWALDFEIDVRSQYSTICN